VQIRKITHNTLDDFPELKEQGFNSHDMYLVWRSYQDDVEENLLYPSNPYIKFLDLGSFYVTHKKLAYRKTTILADVAFTTSKKKIDSLIHLCERYIGFYKSLIDYLEGYSERADRHIKEFNILITRIEGFIKELKDYNYEHHEKLTSRDMEEQSTDSRGNQEQDI
jgi:hypothetical protein